MTSEQFQKYFALFKKLLESGDRQYHEIAGELEDHLQQRSEQLIEEGHAPDRAEEIALQELGDVTQLAASFSRLSCNKRRRWMMRFTTFAIVGSFVGVLFIMSMWPQNGPGPQGVIGQDPFGGSNSKPTVQAPAVVQAPRLASKVKEMSVFRQRSEAEQRAYDALELSLKGIEFIELPFSEFTAQVSAEVGVSIVVSKSYLENNGVEDTPVTLRLTEVKLSTLLDLVMKDQLELDDYVIGVKDSFIYVGSKDSLPELMEMRVYDCQDFAVEATVTIPDYSGLHPQMYGVGGMGGTGGGNGGGGFFCVEGTVQPAGQQGMQGGGLGGQMGGGGQGGGGRGGGGMVDPAMVRQKTMKIQDLSELIGCVENTIDAESWSNMGGVATLNQVGTSLVINQSLKNHLAIEEMLTMLRKVKKQ